jgi:prostaglandin-E synthase 1
METITAQNAFLPYALATIVLSLNMLGLWVKSGFVRAKTKTVMNQEDAASVARGSSLVERDPPEVARVLRAHRNAVDNIIPFLVLGLVFVALGGSALVMWIVAAAFVGFRIAHSVSYVTEKQPYRSLSFVAGLLTTLVLIGFTLVRLVQAA